MLIHRCQPMGGPDDDGTPEGGFGPQPGAAEDLPYRVEVWDPTNSYIAQIVAVAANATIGYAAYYAAIREDIGRHITLSRNGEVLIRWTRRSH